jgi:outer membrane murein-binding lipoprotein Lpp
VIVCIILAVICGGYLVQVAAGADAQKRDEVSSEIRSAQQALLDRQRELGQWELSLRQRESAQASKEWVSGQIIAIGSLIPKHVTLSSLKISESQIVLVGIAGGRSDVGELVNALRLHEQTRDVSVETLKDSTVNRQTVQEFVIRVVSRASIEIGLSDARSESREKDRITD